MPVDPALAKRAKRRNRIGFARGGSFPQGVASGGPDPRGISLWTRLEGATGTARSALEVARDPDFRRVVKRRTLIVRAASDHTVETRVAGKFLKPGEEYFYRFETKRRRARSAASAPRLPGDSREPVKIVFFSCQDWQAGYFGAHGRSPARTPTWSCASATTSTSATSTTARARTPWAPTRTARSRRWPSTAPSTGMYKADADLRAMHASRPFAAIWDDHEVEDNYAGTNAGEETQQKRVPFLTRQQNGYRAFYEYMPFSR